MKNGAKVIVRSDRAGVFYGTLEKYAAGEALLTECRRIWCWEGAATLSQLAQDGTSKPAECKFPPPVDRHLVIGVIEVLATTPKAQKSIEGVKEWTA